MLKVPPNKSPDLNSLFIILHQSLIEISSNAIACIINVAACDPLFPPLEMINGMNVARITTFAISFSKLDMAKMVSNSPKNKIINHTILFLYN